MSKRIWKGTLAVGNPEEALEAGPDRIAYNAFLNEARRPVRVLSLESGAGEALPDPSLAADEALSAREVSQRLRRSVP